MIVKNDSEIGKCKYNKEITHYHVIITREYLFKFCQDCVLAAYENSGTAGAVCKDQDSQARAYNSLVNQGKLSAAVWNLTNRNMGGLLHPSAVETNHPQASVPRTKSSMSILRLMWTRSFPHAFYEEDVLSAASLLSGT
jgi:hypothetical protein